MTKKEIQLKKMIREKGIACKKCGTKKELQITRIQGTDRNEIIEDNYEVYCYKCNCEKYGFTSEKQIAFMKKVSWSPK